MPEFFSPLPLAMVGLLVLNDHVLKARFHNALTGKLSDFAGCFFLPLFLSALLSLAGVASARARLAVGAVATLALFTSVKTSAVAAGAVCGVMGWLGAPLGLSCDGIVVDVTDLAALPMIPLSVWFGVRAQGEFAV